MWGSIGSAPAAAAAAGDSGALGACAMQPIAAPPLSAVPADVSACCSSPGADLSMPNGVHVNGGLGGGEASLQARLLPRTTGSARRAHAGPPGFQREAWMLGEALGRGGME